METLRKYSQHKKYYQGLMPTEQSQQNLHRKKVAFKTSKDAGYKNRKGMQLTQLQ